MRITRISEADTDYALIVANEIQVWVGGVNVALSLNGGAGTTPPDMLYSGWHNNNNINDQAMPLTSANTSRSPASGVNNASNIGKYIELTLGQNYNVYDIQSIVHYSFNDIESRNEGTRIELLDANDVVLYNSPVISSTEWSGIKYYRFDGPSSIPSSLFTTNSTGSISQIMNESGRGITWNILDYANEPEP